LNDKKLILELHKWVEQQKAASENKGTLTEGYGIWAEDAPFDENNYRDQLWQPERNVW
jgi:hypothetical protein